LLLHVVDSGDPERDEYIATVNEVLREMGADKVPQIEVFNKIDTTGHEPSLERGPDGLVRRIWVSAVTGAGLELLRQEIGVRLKSDTLHAWIRLPPSHARARAAFFDLGAVKSEKGDEQGGYLLEVELPRREYQRLCRREGLEPEALAV
jgi:GTP-binding protein HflX